MKKTPPLKVRPKRKPTDPKRLLFTRFMLIVAVFILWIGGIGVRLVHLQVNQHEYLLAKARAQRTDVKKSKMMRGTIFDRNGSLLAISERVKTLVANPMEIEDVKVAAREIAKATGLDAKKLLSQLTEAKSTEKQY